MQVEIFRNGKKIAGKMKYDPVTVSQIVARQGGDARLVPANLTSAVNIASIVIKPVREVRPNLQPGQRHTGPSRSETDFEVVYEYGVGERSEDDLRASLLSSLSRIHELYEGGRLAHRGLLLKVDMEARINAQATLNMYVSGELSGTVHWRGKQGVNGSPVDPNTGLPEQLENATITIANTAEMQALYNAIVDYLNRGFTARTTVEAEINAADRAALVAFNANGRFYDVATA